MKDAEFMMGGQSGDGLARQRKQHRQTTAVFCSPTQDGAEDSEPLALGSSLQGMAGTE